LESINTELSQNLNNLDAIYEERMQRIEALLVQMNGKETNTTEE